MTPLSRRDFLTITAASLAAAPTLLAAPGALTAAEILARVKDKLGGTWTADTVDGIKAGDLDTPVTGIVTTALASLEVLRAATGAGANMVVTSEPVFFSRADTPTPPVRRMPGAPPPPADAPPPPPDPVFTAKAAFLKEHRMVVLRLGEHWRMQKPDPFAVGFAKDLRWQTYANKTDPLRLNIPAMPLDGLVSHVKTKLGSRGGIRVIGDRKLQVKTVGFLSGSTAIQASLDMLPQVDALVVGEVREWEAVEYVRDTVALGGKKALIYVGRVVSEEPGMRQCADWLKTVVPGLPITFRSAGDPYWRPTA